MRIAAYGCGNLGRSVEAAARAAEDMELVGIFTRRDPSCVAAAEGGTPIYSAQEIMQHQDEIDVLIICGGSATDLPTLTPDLAHHFHVVDSFDTHAKIPEHFSRTDAAAKETGHLALISAGWDPGLFSLARTYFTSVLPGAEPYTFWGRGVSQGHSDAIRRIPGVQDARQYTVPVEEALEAVRLGKNPQLSTRDKHRRECYVVLKPGANPAEVEQAIVTMPNYFADYDTTVHFISQEELDHSHRGMPHGGSVLCAGSTGLCDRHKQVMELRLQLESNPEFTAAVLVACARAVNRMAHRGRIGAVTMLDVAPADLSPLSSEELRRQLL